MKSIRVSAIFGLISSLLLLYTGDGSAYNVAQRQPVKLAAMEGLYEGKNGTGLIAIGILNPEKKSYNDTVPSYLYKVNSKLLSFFAIGTPMLVPGLKDIIERI